MLEIPHTFVVYELCFPATADNAFISKHNKLAHRCTLCTVDSGKAEVHSLMCRNAENAFSASMCWRQSSLCQWFPMTGQSSTLQHLPTSKLANITSSADHLEVLHTQLFMSPLRRHIFVCFMAKSAFWRGFSALAPYTGVGPI